MPSVTDLMTRTWCWLVTVVTVLAGISLAHPNQGRNLESKKSLQICSVLGGLDTTRLRSSNARSLFRGAIEDVELMREYFSEAVFNGGIRHPLANLETLRRTLNHEARNLSSDLDTLSAGLGFSDDSPDRRIDHLTSGSANMPFVGDKQTDSDMMRTLSYIMPWIIDRRSHEDAWLVDHQNGRSQAQDMEPLLFRSLYKAGYILSWADTILYYPPVVRLAPPTSAADLFGGNFSSHGFVVGAGFLPDENPERRSAFYGPYPDYGFPGYALITATTPVYYTGTFMNYTFNNTYIAHAGIDISLNAVSVLFDDLLDTLTEGSFALLVSSETLSPVAISQSVVEIIYPERTGFEESRVTRQTSDNSIVDDRRNQTYLVSDTIHQSLLQNVTSADWALLYQAIQETERGERGHIELNLTRTGQQEPIPYYVMFDRWKYVADWSLLVLAPIEAVQNAISVSFSSQSIQMDTLDGVDEVQGSIILANQGTLDVRIRPSQWPSWLRFEGQVADLIANSSQMTLESGASIDVSFVVKARQLDRGTWLNTISFHVMDDHYNDCFFDRDLSFDLVVRVTTLEDRNEIGSMVILGWILMGIVMLSSLGFIAWIVVNSKAKIVRHSQPKFLIMLCCGTLVLSSSIVTMGIDDNNSSLQAADRACMATPWLVSTGFIIAFSALFSKIWRVHKIFKNPSFRKIRVTEQDVLVPFFVLSFLNFGLLLGWTLTDPLQFQRLPVDADPLNTYGTCRFEKNGTAALAVATVAVNFGAIILACIQAYRSREISDEFSESKYVGLTVASWLQVFVVGFPVMFLVSENPTATYFLRSSIIFVACMSLLLFIFVPKVLIHRKLSNEGPAAHISASSRSSGSKVRLVRESRNINPSDPSAQGFGVQIVRSPAITESLMEDIQAHSRLSALEERIKELERENRGLRGESREGGSSRSPVERSTEDEKLTTASIATGLDCDT